MAKKKPSPKRKSPVKPKREVKKRGRPERSKAARGSNSKRAKPAKRRGNDRPNPTPQPNIAPRATTTFRNSRELTCIITEDHALRLGVKAPVGTSFQLPGDSSVTYSITKWVILDPPEPIKHPLRRKKS